MEGAATVTTYYSSRWFHAEELGCHDGTPYPVAWMDRLGALCSQLDIIRGEWGGPIRIVSGYRTPAWNAHVGGAKLSQHMQGLAADICPMVASAAKHACVIDLHRRIIRLYGEGRLPLLGGLGDYPGKWIHVDVRPRLDGHLAQWQGTGVGSEIA